MKQAKEVKEPFANDPEFQELLQRVQRLQQQRKAEGIKARRKAVKS